MDTSFGSDLSRRTLLRAVPGLAVAAALVPQAATAAEARPRANVPLRVRGVDLSFTLQEEAAGKRFSDGGTVRRVEQIFAQRGATLVRLRVWVNPPAGYSTQATAITLAQRARAAGLKVLLDLHYSDFWADPGKQTTPAAWAGQSLSTMTTTVRNYTRNIVAAFASAGAPVDMVQVGNEITGGMLWPNGQIYRSNGEHWSEFTTLLNAGIAGARAGNPAGHPMEVMVHIDRGGDNGGSRYFYDHLRTFGVSYDVIGLSYYPFWHGSLATMQANLNDLAGRYGKPLVLAETSYPWTTANGDSLGNFITSTSQLPDGSRFPPTTAGQAAYFEALRGVLRSVPNGLGAGFIDWEPEWIPGVGWEPGAGNPNDNLTMFDFNGRALPVLTAFRPG
ncbi:MAG TPA: glycosyl hydrolase 53 family protein [Mycobacteriales bacterium]|nr:glycosyl hydrolase 53 family protein [Mycobacteriales bacterium]